VLAPHREAGAAAGLVAYQQVCNPGGQVLGGGAFGFGKKEADTKVKLAIQRRHGQGAWANSNNLHTRLYEKLLARHLKRRDDEWVTSLDVRQTSDIAT
jgi:hypothetical protein